MRNASVFGLSMPESTCLLLASGLPSSTLPDSGPRTPDISSHFVIRDCEDCGVTLASLGAAPIRVLLRPMPAESELNIAMCGRPAGEYCKERIPPFGLDPDSSLILCAGQHMHPTEHAVRLLLSRGAHLFAAVSILARSLVLDDASAD